MNDMWRILFAAVLVGAIVALPLTLVVVALVKGMLVVQ